MTDPAQQASDGDVDDGAAFARTQPMPVVGAPAPKTKPVGTESVRQVPQRPHVRLGTRWAAVLLAAVAGGLLWLTCRIFLSSAAGQRLDESAFRGAIYGQGKLLLIAQPVLSVVSVTFVVVGLAAAMMIALIRLRWGLALQVAVLVGGANITTQLLKYQVLERADLGVPVEQIKNSLPSGHTTVAASVSVALLLVVPRRLRPVVALAGAAYTAATGISTMAGQWHRPSDVIAAFLVVLVWTALVCVVTPRSSLDRGAGTAAVPTAVGATILAVVLLGAGAVAYVVLDGGHVPLLAQQAADAPDVRAYLGMASAVVAATAGLFLSSLLLRQASARG